MCVSSLLILEIKKIVRDSEIMKEDDAKWPEKNKDGRQELEIRLGNEHISRYGSPTRSKNCYLEQKIKTLTILWGDRRQRLAHSWRLRSLRIQRDCVYSTTSCRI